MDDHELIKKQILVHSRADDRQALRSGEMFCIPNGLPFGVGTGGPAAQVQLDVAFAVANGSAELPVPAAGSLDALLRQEAFADGEALSRFRGPEQAIKDHACNSVIHLRSCSPVDERRQSVTGMT